MNNKLKTRLLLLALLFCTSLIGVSFAYSAIPEKSDVETGAQLIENKIDFLLSSLEDDPDIKISENFKESSHIYKWIQYAIKNPDVPIYYAVEQTGKLHEIGDPLQANIQLNETIKKLLELVRLHEDVDQGDLDVIDRLIALLDSSPEAYGPAGIITSAAGDNKGTGEDPIEVERRPTEGGDFRYYGKLYDLNTDVIADGNGGLWFDTPDDLSYVYYWDEICSPMLTPFYVAPYSESSHVVSGGTVSTVTLSNVDYRMYSWNVSSTYASHGRSAIVSAKLFKDPDNSIIVFDYYNEPDVVAAFGGHLWGNAGLLPGYGSVGQPGVGVSRDWCTGINSLDPASAINTPFQYHTYGDYTAVGNSDGYWDYGGDIMLDTFFVFMPDGWDNANSVGPTYRVTFGTRNLVVDSLSVDEAIDNIIGDPGSLSSIYAGEYSPGTFNSGGSWTTVYNYDGTTSTTFNFWDGYEYGLQTVGQPDGNNPNPLPPESYIADLEWINETISRDMLNRDGLLAYMVQVEEDRLNRKIIDMANNAAAINNRVSAYRALGYSGIRARDAAFVEMADAQSGKVLKDIHGNWVRVQQYILRPDNMTVQLLNVCLRGGNGPLAGITAMDFTTTFGNAGGYGIDQDLRVLPWHEWLNTQTAGYRYVVNSHQYVVLDSMSVKFVNPGQESLAETRTFNQNIEQDFINRNIQRISSEQLDLIKNNVLNTYNYVSGSPGSSEYTIGSAGPGTGFYYDLGGENSDIQVDFYAVGDEDDSGNHEYGNIVNDIWDALAVNQPDGPNIGDSSNLEIIIDPIGSGNNYFNNPIDVVYVPMARMLWKNKMVTGDVPN